MKSSQGLDKELVLEQLWGTGPTGQYTDAETGFQYLRARYYDPTTGQFLTRDPIEAVTREPYGYVGGNPLNRVDPSGLEWWDPRDNVLQVADDAWDATGGKAVTFVSEDPGRALTYTAIGLGGAALIIGTGAFAGVPVLSSLAAGSTTTWLGAASTVATIGATAADWRLGPGPRTAGAAEITGGIATTLLGRVPGASTAIRYVASNALAFVFDLAGLGNGRLAC